MKILLVDDDAVIRTGMRKMISKDMNDAHVIEECTNGRSALAYVEEHRDVDLIITDVRMPLMDGLQLIEEVSKIDTDVKFIVLSGFDEFSYVRRAFREGAVDYLLKPLNREEFVDRIRRIEKDNEDKNRDKERKKTYTEVVLSEKLKSAFRNEENAMEELGKHLAGVAGQAYYVVVIELALYYRNNIIRQNVSAYVSKVKALLRYKIAELSGYQVHLCSEENAVCGVIFLPEEGTVKDIETVFAHIIEDARDAFMLSAGISNPYSELSSLYNAYMEAMEAVQLKFYKGNNKVYHYCESIGKNVDDNYEIMPLVDKLVQEIELMDYPKVRNTINQFFIDISFMKPQKIRTYIEDIMHMLVLRIQDFEKALNYSGYDYNWIIKNIGTYNEMKEYVVSLMKNCIQFLTNEKQKKQTHRIEVSKTYLNEHYMEPLSLNDVAAYVELNPSYFSNLFKTEMGMNFSEYLMKVRMEKAMQLLRDPKIKVYEIGNMVGYEDAVSFGRAFKKYIGMSPKEYRNTVY